MNIYSYFNKNNDTNRKTKRGVNIFMLGLLLMFVVIVFRLFSLQVLDSEKYKILSKKQSQSREIIESPRGYIYDRNMNSFVSNVFRVSVSADPFKIKNIDTVAIVLSNVFNKEKSFYLDKLNDKSNNAFYLERKVEINDLKGLDTLRIEGLNVFKEPARYYNFGQLGSQIIGYDDMDNKGVAGIELAFNKELTGKEGYMIARKDGRGVKRPDYTYIQKEPEQGNNIILTIDKNIQQIAEEELANGVNYFNAVKGKAVIVSVKTGEVLAMCNFPTFNPNNIKSEDSVGMKNAVISDIYEPGSTFKLITASAILEEKIYNPDDVLNTENGSYTVYGMKITDSYPASSLSFQQIIEKSSNIGVAKLSQKLGAERFFKYARDYGFGIYTGIEINGENRGYLKRPLDFTNGSLEFMAIGYQVAVNALQLTMAYSAIANNGLLMKPYIVKKIISADGNILSENKPSPVRQVISQETAKKLNEMFKGVVEKGTGTDAKLENVKVAGKTGTTQKLVEGEYSSSSHISSFVGYYPADNPEIIITIIIDDPKNGFYGGKVAAPIFKKIADRINVFYGNSGLNSEYVEVKNTETKNEPVSEKYKIIPNLVDMRLSDAILILNEKNISYEIENNSFENPQSNNVLVVNQNPAGGQRIDENIKVKITAKRNNDVSENIKILTDVRGLSLRKSISKLISEGYAVDINGSGEVVDMYPKPGSKVNYKSKIILFCKEDVR